VRGVRVAYLLIPLALTAASWAAPPAQVRGSVVDENGVPVAGAEVSVRAASGETRIAYTDLAGRFEFPFLAPGVVHLTLGKAGFFRLADHPVELKEGANELSFTLAHETEVHEKVEVVSSASRVDAQETAHQETLLAHEIRDIPVRSTHDLKNSLPALPGIVRDTAAQLHIAGARVGEVQMQLDGFEIGNPATGELDARLAVDTVRAVEVQSGRYSAQYAHAGAGVLGLESVAGDDRWRFGTTNFIPGINLDRGTHFGNWYPRFTFSGPLRKGHAWFSEAASVQRTLKVVKEQPPGADTVTQWAGDNLLRLQTNLTPAHVLQASFLYNRSSAEHFGLGAFSPESTTTNRNARRLFVSVKDQVWLGRTLTEFGVAGDTAKSEQLPQGSATFIILPNVTGGNFLETLRQRARRLQFLGNLVAASRQWHGTHEFQGGLNVASVDFRQSAERNAIQVERADLSRSQLTTFVGPAAYRISNTQLGGYAQDSWRLARPLILQIGARADRDRLFGRTLAEPRIAANVLPFPDDRAKLAVAWGIYDQAIPLALVGQALDEQRTDVFFDATGQNVILGPTASRFVLPPGGLKQPRFYTTSIEWVERFGANTLASIHLMNRQEHEGLAYEDRTPGQPGAVFLLQNNRRDRYRAAEVTLRHSFSGKAEIFGSYTRSRANTNEALNPTLGSLLFAAQAPGPVSWDVPNRALAWGWTPLPLWHILLSFFFEYRSGFPFNVINQQQQLVGPPGTLRFPDYASLNLGLEKRFRFGGYQWAARLTLVNVTDHANPDQVVNNVDAVNFLTFAGGQHRSVTARLRFVGRK
jgi:Carboxypeptidase regulatory-like domain/TonB dependent receptor